MKNTMLFPLLFSLLIIFGCEDNRNERDTEDVPPLQEGLNNIQGTPPNEIAPQPRVGDDQTPNRVDTTMQSNVTDREIEQYVKINRRLETMDLQTGQNSNIQMNRIVEEEGLNMRRYQEIGVTLQNDPTLQDKMTRYQNENRQ